MELWRSSKLRQFVFVGSLSFVRFVRLDEFFKSAAVTLTSR